MLPAAIELSCWVAAATRGDRELVIHSQNFDETVEANLDFLPIPGKNHWANYPLGVAWALERAGRRLGGANLLIHGEVPLGAGLSSSAAVEVAVGFALLEQSGHDIDRTQLARWCQSAENQFVGARSGIMDQFISCHGMISHALLLDCRSLEHKPVRLPPGIQLVMCNTLVKHEIASGEYNQRRAECEEAVRALQKVLPEVRALRDVSLPQLHEHRRLLTPKVFLRCRHVITENARVEAAVTALGRGDLRALGPLMRDSHRSLRDDYEVSCRELDVMVEIASAERGVLGARMTGGGWGGCTVNLVEGPAVETFKRNVASGYLAKTGLSTTIYVSRASEGVSSAQPAAP